MNRVILFLVAACLSSSPEAEIQNPTTKFQLETFKESAFKFTNPVEPLHLAPPVDSEAVFRSVIACYPSPSMFDISLKLQAGTNLFDEKNSFNTLTERGNYYVGLVAEMPLIDNSATTERERQREYERRKETSAQVAKFIAALSKRNQAEREMGLYSALERRARVRVQMGITSVQEQVQYLEKVIASQQKITAAVAEITEARMSLEGQCQDNKRTPLAHYLQGLEKTGGG